MKLIDILHKVNKYGAMLILTAPLWVNNSFIFPYVHLKNIFFRVVILILSISLSWYLLERKKYKARKNYVTYALLAFLLIQFIASLLGVNFSHSWWGSWERMDGLINLSLLVLYFILLGRVFQTKTDWLKIMRASLLVAVVVGLYGLIKNGLNISNNEWSTLGNSAFLGFYMLLNMGLAVLAWRLDKLSRWRWFYLGAAVFLLLIMLGAASRAPILGWLVGWLVAGLFYLPRAGKKFRYYFIGALILLLIVGGLVVANKNSSTVKKIHFLNRLAQISRTDSTTHNRLLVWQASWRAFKDKPFLGWGTENFSYAINKHYNPLISEQWFDRAHNFVFDYLVTGGLVGLLSYLALWATALYLIWRGRHKDYKLSLLLLGWITAYLFSSLFVFDTLNSWLVVLLVLAFVEWWYNTERAEAEEKELAAGWQKMYYVILTAVSLTAVLGVYYAAYQPARANYLTGKAYQYSQANPDKAITYYKQAWQLGVIGRREIVLQLMRYSLAATGANQVDLKTKKKIFELAEAKALEFLQSDPHNLQVRMVLGELYLKYSQLNTFYVDEAINLLKVGLADSPRRINIYLMLAQAENMKGDYKAVVKYLEQALKLDPESKLVYENLMNFYSRLGMKDKFVKVSREYLRRFPHLSAEAYRKLGEYYFRLKMYRAAKNILTEKAIPTEPDNWRSYISLASLYVEEGQKQKAIDFLQQAVKEHPNFKGIVEKYLENIK